MASIDERIVSMVFENAKFEAGAAKTLATLTKLDDSLKKLGQNNSTAAAFDNIEKSANKVTLQAPLNALDKLKGRFGRSGNDAAQGMSQIEAAGNKVQLEQPIRALDKVQAKTANVGAQAADGFNEIEKASGHVVLDGLNRSLDGVTAKFSTMQAAASVAMGNITSQAAMKGANFAKSFALGPLQQGFGEYQTNLNSIQTILANTEGQKVSGLDNVNKSLGELNTYSDQTIYNFSEMAKNIGTFTAAGVDLPKSVSSIKGIANLAALSGSNSQQASTAMYQLSQAIAAGRVGLQDWNSVVNAGMGGAKFQQSLMRTAENMGALKKGAVNIDKATGKATVNGESFRNSIMAKPGEESWLTSDVLTSTLSQMTGDMSDAQLKAQGFSAEQVKAIQAQAKTAKAAATEVKTLPQVWDVARETIGSGWAQSSQLIFGNFKESKKTFTELSNAVNGVINHMSKARNHILKVWSDLGGRTKLIEGIKVSLNTVVQVIHALSGAFRRIFPKKTGKDLYEFTTAFVALAKRIQSFVLENRGTLQNTFAGFFAVIHIGTSIVKGIIGVIAHLLGMVGHGSGGFLLLTARMGLWLESVDKALTKGGLLTKFFQRLENILKKPMELIGHLTSGFGNLFGGGGKVADNMNKVKGAAGPMGDALSRLQKIWHGFVKMLDQAKSLVSPWLDKIGKEMSRISDVFKSAFSDKNIGKTTAILQTALMGGIFLTIRKAITGGVTELGAGLKGIKSVLGGVKDVLGGLTGQLQAMQQKVKAQALEHIAIAVGILAGSAWLLSKIPAEDLTRAMGAMAIGLGEVFAAMAVINRGGFGKGASMATIATGMILISSAILILSGAMKVMASMSWEELTKGMAGIGGGLGIIARAMALMPPGRYMIIQAGALVVIAGALNILAVAMKIFASMSWEELARGLAGVLGSLVALIVPLEALVGIGPGLLFVAPALIGIGVAMNLLATSLKIFASMDSKTLVKGLFAFTATLLLLSEAMWAFPPGPYLIAQAAGMLVLGVALQGIAVSLAMFGGLGVGQIIKGLLAMGGAMLVLGAGLIFMEGTLPGAVALLAAAAALAILGPAIGFIGSLKIMTIVKGLAAIAAVLAVLSLAGIYAGPGLAALGTSMLPLAGVMVAAAGATFLFAKALEIMGGAGAKGVGVMIAAITAFVLLIPNWVITLLKGLVGVVEEIAKVLPKVIDALDKIITQIIAFVIREAPKLGLAFAAIFDAVVKLVNEKAPDLINAGWNLLTKFLSGIENNVGQVTAKAANIVIKFLNALTAKAPELVTAGANLLGKFLTGIGQRAEGLAAKAANIVLKFISGIAMKLPDLFTIGSRVLAKFIEGVGSHVERLVRAGGRAVLHILSGIGDQIEPIKEKALWLARKFINGFVDGVVGLADRVASGVIRLMNGLADVIRKRDDEFWAAAKNLGHAIGEGLAVGIKEAMPGPVKAAFKVASKVTGVFHKEHETKSPSRVFMRHGANLMTGLAMGIDRGSGVAENAASRSATDIVGTMQKTMKNVPNLLDGIAETDPVISPVLDLSQIKRDAGAIGDITNVPPIKADVSANQASVIARQKTSIDQAQAEQVAAAAKPSVEFKQINNSPEALPAAEIYRRTNNAISQIRKQVGVLSE